jgi:hypothetical protein
MNDNHGRHRLPASPDPGAYRLRVGEVVIELVCADPELAPALARYFASPDDPADPHVSLALHVVEHAEPPAVPSSLVLTKRVVGGGFDIADGLIRGAYDPATGRGELHVAAILTGGLMTRVFEQILYQAFHAALARSDWDAALVHSAGVVRDGRGYLFVGESGVGKTTIADLSRDAAVLNDEMNVIAFDAAGPRLLASPFNGHYRDKQPAAAPLSAAPLAAVLLPRHADAHRVEDVGAGRAAAEVAAQVCPPVTLDAAADQRTTAAMLDTATRLVSAAPVRRLLFRPDAGFWPLLIDAFTPDPRG